MTEELNKVNNQFIVDITEKDGDFIYYDNGNCIVVDTTSELVRIEKNSDIFTCYKGLDSFELSKESLAELKDAIELDLKFKKKEVELIETKFIDWIK